MKLRISYCLLVSFLLTAVLVSRLNAGDIITEDGRTVIKVRIYNLPKATDPSVNAQADVAVYKEFIRRFPEIFSKRLKDKYAADPDKYGRYNWDNVSVVLEPFSGIKVEGVESDLLAIAGGMAPDILYVNFRKSDNYIMNNFLYPLDEYFEQLDENQVDFRVNPKIWPVIRRKGPRGKEHVWAMPIGGALGKVLLYRKDLFDEQGLEYPTASWTWEDMYRAAKKLTVPDKGLYGLQLGQGKQESWYWITFLWSAGGDVMKYNSKLDKWSCTFNTAGAVDALEFYNRLATEKWTDHNGQIRRGYCIQNASEADYKWERGEVGMKTDYVDEKLLSKINPELTGMAPVPLGPTGLRGAELNSRMYGIYSHIEEPAVRDAAWEYIRFYTSIEAERIRTKIMVEGGMGQFLNPKYLKMFGYNEIVKLSPKGWEETFKIAIETGIPEPYGKNSNVAYEMMSVPIQQLASISLNDQLPENNEERRNLIAGLLDDACDRANEIMIGEITPQEKSKRRIVAVIVLLAIFTVFSLVFRRIIKAFTPEQNDRKDRAAWNFKKYFWAYILLLPAVLSILVWQYIPLSRGSIMAFYDYKILGESTFVGVDNFGNLLFDNAWWASVFNALRYSLLVLSLTFMPPIVLAILLQEVPRGKIFFRTIYYLPAVVTGVVTTLLWKQFYDPSEYGALNTVIMKIPAIGFVIIGLLFFLICYAFARRLWIHEMNLAGWFFVLIGVLLFISICGISWPILVYPYETISEALPHIPGRLFDVIGEPYRWLTNPDSAMRSCVLPMVWAGMGPGCLIYLAALKGIPEDYYEAADLDGANFIDKILFIVFPMLKPLIIINFVGVFIQSWYNATANILVMTGGGADTETAGLHIWYKAFTYMQFGPATAMAWMLGFILIGFTVHQLRILSKVEFRSQGSAK